MKKIKVGIEIEDVTQKKIDMSCPQLGNPGIGGSGYEALLLAWALKNSDNIKEADTPIVTVYHNEQSNVIPDNCEECIVSDGIDALSKAVDNFENIYICNTNHGHDWYEYLRNTDLKVIIWAGCYIEYDEIVEIKNTSNVVRVVCVSQEEYDYYYDDDIISKMCVINNMINISAYNLRKPINEIANTVTYVGSLVPQKGFLELAKIWKGVLDEVPDAQLNVIGTGQLYRRDQELGKYGIAEEIFENSFIKYLTDSRGNIMESVHFLGLLGEEKEKVFSDTKVGVVNPSALTETFCISGVEMQACGIPVVTRKKHGLLSTVINGKTGYLFNTRNDFKTSLIKLLKNGKVNKEYSQQARIFVTEEFDYRNVIDQWLNVFNDIEENIKTYAKFSKRNYLNDVKWFKYLNAYFRHKCKIKNLPSSIDYKEMYFNVGHRVMAWVRKIKR